MKIQIKLLLTLIILSFSLQAYAQEQILIATQRSKFKNALATEISQRLQKQDYIVKQISITKLAKESADDYKSVVMLNACRAGKANGNVSKFLKETTDLKPIIVVTTADSPNCKLGVSGVDAVTCASPMNELNSLADSIINKIEK